MDCPGRIQKDRPDRHALQNKSLFHTIPVEKFSDLRSNHTAAKMRRDSKKRHRICPIARSSIMIHGANTRRIRSGTINSRNDIIRNVFLLKRQSFFLLIMLPSHQGPEPLLLSLHRKNNAAATTQVTRRTTERSICPPGTRTPRTGTR